ncbi:hypothetical protein CDAR_18561 [Caerostris darwini]|uniref:Uncharacterized protein n=1 Tax=Caerostris darwini TaxID=1538125 RepID=A0AAV4VB04_9ARAC|nr:hypothetical protein CDAR_18561 [Caerostris darwini]
MNPPGWSLLQRFSMGGTSCAMERFGRKELLMVVLCLPSLPILWVVATLRQHGKQDVDYGSATCSQVTNLPTRSLINAPGGLIWGDAHNKEQPINSRYSVSPSGATREGDDDTRNILHIWGAFRRSGERDGLRTRSSSSSASVCLSADLPHANAPACLYPQKELQGEKTA